MKFFLPPFDFIEEFPFYCLEFVGPFKVILHGLRKGLAVIRSELPNVGGALPHIFNMTPENPGKILQQELVCEICGELFNTVESLKQHREAEITTEEAGAGV
jgi:hypothetical protein